MVCAQLVAFGRVSQFREEHRERKRIKERAAAKTRMMDDDAAYGRNGKYPPNGYERHMNGGQDSRKLSIVHEETYFD